MVARRKQHAGLAVRYEPRQAADSGRNGRLSGARSLRHGVGEGFRQGAYGVYVDAGIVSVHAVAYPASEKHLVAHAELLAQTLEHFALHAVAGNEQAQPLVFLRRSGKAAYGGGDVLDRIKASRDAENYAVVGKITADLAKPLSPRDARRRVRKVNAVIYRQQIVRVKAAIDERLTHTVGNADAVVHMMQRKLVEPAVGHGGQRPAEIIELIVAVDGADKGNVKMPFQQRSRKVCAAAVAMDDVVISVFYGLARLFQPHAEAAGEHPRRYAHFARFF